MKQRAAIEEEIRAIEKRLQEINWLKQQRVLQLLEEQQHFVLD